MIPKDAYERLFGGKIPKVKIPKNLKTKVDINNSNTWKSKCSECGGIMDYFNLRYCCRKCGNILEV
jgi:ribosomal protein S27AE